MAMLEPKFAVLDETDSGLDVDALKVVCQGVNTMRGPGLGVLIITHYTRILRYIQPDVVHVMFEGRIARTGRPGAGRLPRGARLRRVRRGRGGRGARGLSRWARPRRHRRRPRCGPTSRSWGGTVHGAPLVYLDSAATSQKPTAVLDAMDAYYRETNANVHRGVYALAAEATARFEAGRDAVARLVGAPREGVVFTKNATEAINLVAWAWGVRNLAPATRCSSPRWSTTRTSCPGRSSPEITGASGPLRAR